MERNRILLLVAAAAAVAVLGYRLTTSHPSAGPDPTAASASASASGAAESSASASPLASSSAPSPVPSIAAGAGDQPEGADAGTSAKADSDGGGMVVGMVAGDGGQAHDTVFVDQAKADTTVSLGRGQKLVVVLKANPTTGFDWSVVKAPPALGKAEMGSIPGAGVGGSGHRKLTFTPKESLPAGEHTVELAYARPFEDAQAPLKTFRFKVRAGN